MLPLLRVLGSNLTTDPPPPGSVAVFRSTTVRCHPGRNHDVTIRHLLRLPSRQHERKRFIQSRAASHTMKCLPTRKAHKRTSITSERSLSRLWRRRCLTRKQRPEQGFQPAGSDAATGADCRLWVSVTKCCNNFSTTGTSGTGIGVVTPTSERQSNSSI